MSAAIRAGCRRAWSARRAAVTEAESYAAWSLAAALGVCDKRVRQWIALGWLTAERLPNHTGYVITAAAVRRFLAARGGLLEMWPNEVWLPTYQASRAALRARYLHTAEVVSLLGVERRSLRDRRRQRGFPEPAIRCSGRVGDWYDRADIRAWLVAHPQDQTPAARREFGL